MSEGQPKPYALEDGAGVKEQVAAILKASEEAGKLDAFFGTMKAARQKMRTIPTEWGDPEFSAKSVSATVYHAIARPLWFRYVVYEQVRTVMILGVGQYAEFS